MEIRHSGLSQNLKTSKLETLELNADQIIVHATVKEQARFIDKDRPGDTVSYEESPRFIYEDQPEDNVSYEESENRLTYLAFFFAISFGIVSSICLVLIMNVTMIQGPKIRIPWQSRTGQVEDTIPHPHVLLMGKSGIGNGSMLVFQQVNQSYFEYGWKFKLPKQQREVDRYFLFEDLGRIHVAFGNKRLPMTVLNPSTKQHFTIPRSKLRKNFVDGHCLRIGM